MFGTTALASPQQGTEFYAWSFPGAPVLVHLNFEVVQGIGQRLKQVPAAGPSVSTRGLLLGTIDKPGLPQITDFRPLSTGNPAELQEAIAFCKGSGDNLLPIGYFRTHAEDHLALSPDDLLLAQTYFPDPNCVFLLIQPADAGAVNAGFFFWDRGKMNGGFYDFCFREFPFEVSLLTAAAQGNAKTDPRLTRSSPPVEPLPPAADPILSSAILLPETNSTPVEPPENVQETKRNPDTTSKPRRSRRAIRLALTAVLLAVVGFAAGISFMQALAWITRMGRNAGTAPIALKVERQGRDLAVTWNHNSPLVSRADTGRLTIYDGGVREFHLDKEPIRFGSVVYSPVTDQVRVQLDLQGPDQRITSESVMVVLSRPRTRDSSVVVQPVEVRPQHSFPPARFDAGDAGTRVRATRKFLPPRGPAAAESPAPELGPPPRVAKMNSAPTAVLAPALILPPSQPPPLPKPSSKSNTGAQPRAFSKPSERLSPIGASDYIPPVPIRQTLPPLTPAQRSFLSRTVVVEIKVFVDASGKVRKTEPLSHANPVLMTAAQSAARLWTFQPARKAGQNVPSEMLLRFKFDPQK